MEHIPTEKSVWYKKSVQETLDLLNSKKEGLDNIDAQKRLEEFGPNSLPESKPPSYFVLFLRQFKSPLIYVLIVAALVVFIIGHTIDALVISVVLLLNAVIGSIQEGKAQDALAALRHFTKTEARVVRDDQAITIDAQDVVPGDIINLRAGDKIPSDARLIYVNHFQVDEATLTGESFPIEKTIDPMNENSLDAAEMKNMIFRGTYVVSGEARAITVSTGLNTYVGGLSQDLSSIDSEIPLKKNIDRIAQFMSFIIVVVSILIFFVGIFLGNSPTDMFLTAVAVAVAVIPEGLPIVITLVLATGVYRMGKQNALVKRLQAVEALGRADVIAVDKTGTITKNELMVSEVFMNSKTYTVSGEGFKAEGNVYFEKESINTDESADIKFAAKIAAFCVNAEVVWDEEEKIWKVVGDPTEASLGVFAEKIGYTKSEIERENPPIQDIPFSQKNKFHATLHKTKEGNFMTLVGAPEGVIDSAKYFYDDGKKRKINDEDKKIFISRLQDLAQRGLRVVAFSVNESAPDELDENSLPPITLVGLFGLQDTLREGVAESVRLAKDSGIQVALITGDYKETAKALAGSAGIYTDGDEVITGRELQDMSQKSLLEKLPNTSVFARVSPKDKLRIVELYKESGKIIAMTGDGVNDSLSLVAADLGIAMGRIGTEVTKEASDIVLLDDNFKTIVTAIEEGKSIFNTVKKVLVYMFSTGFGELLTIVIALFALMPLPLLPSQIIWLNLVTDSFLVMAFAFEPRQKIGASKIKQKKLLDNLLIQRVILMSTVMAFGSLILFSQYLETHSIEYARTVTLTLMAVYQWVNVWNCRRESRSVFSENPFSNIYFLWALLTVSVLQILLIYTPFMQGIFSTVPLNLSDWALIGLYAIPLILAEELRKLIYALFARFKK